MKNIPLKNILIGAGAVLVIAVTIFVLSSNKKDLAAPSFIDPAFGEYISSYSSGVLSSNASLKIVMTKESIDSAMIGQESSVKLFSLSPSIEGKTVWLDKQTVEFTPSKRLLSGQVYTVEFALSKLVEVPDNLKTFSYSFQVIPQNYEVSIENMVPYVKTVLKDQKILGIVQTADYAEDKQVEDAIQAKQEGKALNVTWTHGSGGVSHHFTIENISRKDNASKVIMNVNGEHLGVDKNHEEEIEIPSLSDFKLMNAKVVQTPNQYAILQFSDPLKENQNVQGLIRMDKIATLDLEVHDNEIWVYPPSRLSGTKKIHIEAGIRNILDYKMKNSASAEIIFEQLKPAVRFTGNGSILPSTDGLILPFEAVNLKSVDVKISKIFQNNVLQFLQVNQLGGDYQMNRVGRTILKKKISLQASGVTDLGKWNRFTLDLAELIKAEPGAIYQVKLDFQKAYSAYFCEGQEDEVDLNEIEEGYEDEYYEGKDDYYYEEDYYYYDYDWSERENPCTKSYYIYNQAKTKNVLASDLGLIAKAGSDGTTVALVTDLKTTQPISGVTVELYDYQLQLLGNATTSIDGKVFISSKHPPFALVAKQGAQRGYLKLNDGESLSMSNFDISGASIQKGLKGLIYGERGVWRPGDSLHLTFVLEDKNKTLPETHPVVFELVNPQGQLVDRQVRTVSKEGFYPFATATAAEAITGNYTARVKVGGANFSKEVKVETVKPNRLKINLDFSTSRFTDPQVTGDLTVKWLHGSPARNLRAQFDVMLTSTPTRFEEFEDYTFVDPTRHFYDESQSIFNGYTDSNGKASIQATLETNSPPPGFLNALFRGKVFEESGNFSIDNFSIPYSPYKHYVGLRVPEGESYTHILYTDKQHTIDIVSLDAEGKSASRTLEVKMYKIDTRWWWDYSSRNVGNYISRNSSQFVQSGTVYTKSGKGSWNFKIETPDWGRYFIQVCDPSSGHCTGKIVYVDEPGWYSRYRENGENKGATMLSFSTDKEKYNIGEKIKVTIPGSGAGRALVSVESGSTVLETFWIETTQGDNQFTIDVTSEMTPNVFVNVSLLQPHSQSVNDLPIRLYGVLPVGVEDPNTHLKPVLTMPDEIEPGQEVVMKIAESSNRKMTYTIAVVDEGLLDLTRFKTPDLWSHFYAREALGVKTWDLYDDVMGAFGSRVERLLAIGGGGELEAKEDDARANRFKPVVKFFGPYTIDGKTAIHKFIMPQYVGSVRTMVVAGQNGSYGSTEKATPVRKPLMVLATLPRVLGPEEKVKLPVTLFTSDKSIKSVKIDVKVSGPVSILGSASKNVPITEIGDMTVDFDLNVKSATGVAKVEVAVSSGKHTSSDVIEINVRNPNPPITQVYDALLNPGKSWSSDVVPLGISGTNTAILEISNMPPVNLGSRLKYLFQYPYGCIEQTTSSVFPQLFLEHVKVLSKREEEVIQKNVTAAIERLKKFVLPNGGFSYWPGGDYGNEWGTSYAGHFLIEAKAKGYYVPADILRSWKKFQRKEAQNWHKDKSYHTSELMQAYRLYTLALSGSAELGAMNRLRESTMSNNTAKWMLAAAYVKAGQPEAANKMISSVSKQVSDYRELHYCYGSHTRDKALIIETLALLNRKTEAFELLKELSEQLSSSYWMSTQEIAFGLKAVSSVAQIDKKGELKYSYTLAGKTLDVVSKLPLSQVEIPIKGMSPGHIAVVNESSGSLFVRLIREGIPARGQETDEAKSLAMSVKYTDIKGKPIDISRLEQGTEFIAEVTVTHPGVFGTYQNMALAQVFPSGWEINNLRLEENEAFLKTGSFTYQNIRDDRVYTYFDLYRNSSKVYRVMLTASYAGEFYLPATVCETMYDNSKYARKQGQVVEVVKPSIQ